MMNKFDEDENEPFNVVNDEEFRQKEHDNIIYVFFDALKKQSLDQTGMQYRSLGLERVQRLFLDIDDSEMVFNEQTLAAMLEAIASNHDEWSDEGKVLQAAADALLGNDPHFKLTLKHKNKGRFISPYEKTDRLFRNKEILYYLAYLEKKGWKTEAAIAHLQAKYKLSRAAVYMAVRDAEDFIKTSNEIFGSFTEITNPRSSNK